MQLNFQQFGSGHPLIILHGLYGSGDNWLTIGKSLSGVSQVFLMDQRNHGTSPHSDTMDYPSLSADLKEFMDHTGIRQAALLGHSMGGKAAMWFAAENPGRVSRLIVADISPRSYLNDTGSSNHSGQHDEILLALRSMDLKALTTIGEVDHDLEKYLPDKRLRQFLLKNLRKTESGHLEWKINLTAISRNISSLADGLDNFVNQGMSLSQFPVLFIRGEKSSYILEPDLVLIRRLFPLARIMTIKNAGHWLHAEEPELFTGIVRKFLIEYQT